MPRLLVKVRTQRQNKEGRTSVVGTIDRAVPRTGGGVGAERGVPGVAGVAVVAARGGVEPAPVGVEHDGALLGLAVAAGRALLDGQAGVILGRERADLLAVCGRDEGEGEESSSGEHCDGSRELVSPMQTVDDVGCFYSSPRACRA